MPKNVRMQVQWETEGIVFGLCNKHCQGEPWSLIVRTIGDPIKRLIREIVTPITEKLCGRPPQRKP